MFRNRLLWISAALICVLAVSFTPVAWGQAMVSGSVVGQVSDPSGAEVPGANVTLTDTATKTYDYGSN